MSSINNKQDRDPPSILDLNHYKLNNGNSPIVNLAFVHINVNNKSELCSLDIDFSHFLLRQFIDPSLTLQYINSDQNFDFNIPGDNLFFLGFIPENINELCGISNPKPKSKVFCVVQDKKRLELAFSSSGWGKPHYLIDRFYGFYGDRKINLPENLEIIFSSSLSIGIWKHVSNNIRIPGNIKKLYNPIILALNCCVTDRFFEMDPNQIKVMQLLLKCQEFTFTENLERYLSWHVVYHTDGRITILHYTLSQLSLL